MVYQEDIERAIEKKIRRMYPRPIAEVVMSLIPIQLDACCFFEDGRDEVAEDRDYTCTAVWGTEEMNILGATMTIEWTDYETTYYHVNRFWAPEEGETEHDLTIELTIALD